MGLIGVKDGHGLLLEEVAVIPTTRRLTCHVSIGQYGTWTQKTMAQTMNFVKFGVADWGHL